MADVWDRGDHAAARFERLGGESKNLLGIGHMLQHITKDYDIEFARWVGRKKVLNLHAVRFV